MNRNHRGRDRDGGRRNYGGAMDGLLGEGPGAGGGGGMMDPVSQMNQLMLAQQLLQKQAALSAGGDFGALAGAMGMQQMMHQQQQQQQFRNAFGGGRMHGGGGNHYGNRKRVGVMDDRDMDSKRRRRSGDHDRSRGDRGRSSRWEKDDREKSPKGKGKKEGDDYDPAEPTEDEENQEEKPNKDKDGNLYCHVCNVSVYDDASFRRHLNGTKHKAYMNSVLTVHQMKSTQLQSRLKAEEHLRKIEGRAGGFDPDYFCKICNNDLTIPWERHRYSNIHKQRQLQVKRGCGWCGVHDFNNFTEVLEHRETEEHKKNADLYGKKDEKETDRKKREHKKEEEEDLTIPEFDAEKPVGRQYIIPVTGYFCKLCNKFYNNEKSAKNAHCQTETHYEKFKAAMEVKIAERQKRKEEEEAAAAARAEEEKAKKMEEGEEDDDDDGGDDDDDDGDVKEVVEEEAEEGIAKGSKATKEEEEDYDDALPMEDSDDEGGLVQFIENDEDHEEKPPAQTDEDSFLNETSANGSFTFMTGEMAQAHLDAQVEMNGQNGAAQESFAEISTDATDFGGWLPPKPFPTAGDEDMEDDVSGEASGLSQEQEEVPPPTAVEQEEEEEEEEVAKPAAKTRGKGSARRGRGRGRAKK